MIRLNPRKKFAALAILAMTVALTPCTGSAQSKPSGTLSFSNWQWLTPDTGPAMWDAITSGYRASNPKAEFKQRSTAFSSYIDKLNTELGAGTAPDVFVVSDAHFATLAAAGLVAPLNKVTEKIKLNNSNDFLKIKGQQFGVTWEAPSYALVGNKNVMAKAGITSMPTTVDELIAAGKKIKAVGDHGFAVRHLISEGGGWYTDFCAWTYANGGSWSDGKKLTIDSAANIKGVTEFAKVMSSGIVPIGDNASTFRSKFMQNKVGFIIENAGAVLSFTASGKLKGKDIETAPLPFSYPGQNQQLILAVNAKSPNKQLAEDFISWILSADGQKVLRGQRQASTLATDVPLSESFSADNPWAAQYIKNGKTARTTVIDGFGSQTAAISQVILEAVERVITKGEDPRKALVEAQAQASKL